MKPVMPALLILLSCTTLELCGLTSLSGEYRSRLPSGDGPRIVGGETRSVVPRFAGTTAVDSRPLVGERRSPGRTPKPVGITAPLNRLLRTESPCAGGSELRRAGRTWRGSVGMFGMVLERSGNRPPGPERGGLERVGEGPGCVVTGRSWSEPLSRLAFAPESTGTLRGRGPSSVLRTGGRF